MLVLEKTSQKQAYKYVHTFFLIYGRKNAVPPAPAQVAVMWFTPGLLLQDSFKWRPVPRQPPSMLWTAFHCLWSALLRLLRPFGYMGLREAGVA